MQEPDEFEALKLTPENCVEELRTITVHCKTACSQLRELLNLPLLDSLEERVSESKTIDRLAKSDPEIDRISRVSYAASDGFLLDQDDLLRTLKMVAQSFNESEINKLTDRLLALKPQQNKSSKIERLREPLQLYEELEKISSAALSILNSMQQC
jgi:hypothetical protein